jgi:hypothetical protein
MESTPLSGEYTCIRGYLQELGRQIDEIQEGNLATVKKLRSRVEAIDGLHQENRCARRREVVKLYSKIEQFPGQFQFHDLYKKSRRQRLVRFFYVSGSFVWLFLSQLSTFKLRSVDTLYSHYSIKRDCA